jgi:gas vesicle protein
MTPIDIIRGRGEADRLLGRDLAYILVKQVNISPETGLKGNHMDRQTTPTDIQQPNIHHLSPEERRKRIAELAYYRAEQRGFAGGDPVQDWLAAEAELDKELESDQEQELAAYKMLRQRVRKILSGARDTINADTIRHAIDKASMQLKDVGEYTSETVNKVAHSLRKDLAATAERIGPQLENVTKRAADLFQVWRDRGGEFLSEASKAVNEWRENIRSRKEFDLYHAGDMTTGGTFECVQCGKRTAYRKMSHITECPQCNGGEFRRV